MATSTGLFHWGSWTWRAADVVAQEIDEEFDFHLECRTRELLDSGLAPDAAAEEARRLFGSRDRLRRQCQTAVYGRGYWLMAAMAVTVVASLGVIGWLMLQLQQAQRQNSVMSALLAAQQPATERKLDLVGAIVDADRKPVANAKVLVIYKSWPDYRYRQQAFEQTSDKDGQFRFKELYSNATQTAFLVSVLADGHVMQSEYIVYEANADVKHFQFRLKPAIEKTLVVHGPNGEVLGDTAVFPGERKPATGKLKAEKDGEFGLLYFQNGAAAGYKTDAAGKVCMPLFQAGDQVELCFRKNDMDEAIRFTVDPHAVQVIGIDAKAGLRGKVTAHGKPLDQAKVLLIHKTWPDGRYQQIPHDTRTQPDGTYRFAAGNVSEDREEFLVTAIKEGFAFQSQYVIKTVGETVNDFEFHLTPAIPKSITLRDAAGKPLAETTVALSQRKNPDGQDQLIYPVSAPAVSFNTDAQGKVALPHFAANDEAELLIRNGDKWTPVRFIVDGKPEQTVTVAEPAAK